MKKYLLFILLIIPIRIYSVNVDTIPLILTRNAQLSSVLDSICQLDELDKRYCSWKEFTVRLKDVPFKEDSISNKTDTITLISVQESFRYYTDIMTFKKHLLGCLIINGGYFFIYNENLNENKIDDIFTLTTNTVMLPRIKWKYFSMAIHERFQLLVLIDGRLIDYNKEMKKGLHANFKIIRKE